LREIVSTLESPEASRSGNFLLAENEHALLGCVYVEPCHLDSNRSAAESEERAYLGLLAVDPGAQQSGLGSLLMDAAEDYCRALGLRFMDIKVVNLREELTGFYGKRGYVETGTSAFPTEVETKLPCHSSICRNRLMQWQASDSGRVKVRYHKISFQESGRGLNTEGVG